MFGCTYAILNFDPGIFVLAWCSTLSQTSLNRLFWLSTITCIILEIEFFTVLNSFAGVLKTYQSFISIRVSGGGKLIRYLS